MPKPVTIAGLAFKSQAEAERHARSILYGDKSSTAIPDVDVPFVEALLVVRPEKLAQLQGRVVARYYIDWQPPEHSGGARKWTRCFWALLDDETRIHFSFKTAIRMIADSEGHGSPVASEGGQS